jgi:hypothetical protein
MNDDVIMTEATKPADCDYNAVSFGIFMRALRAAEIAAECDLRSVRAHRSYGGELIVYVHAANGRYVDIESHPEGWLVSASNYPAKESVVLAAQTEERLRTLIRAARVVAVEGCIAEMRELNDGTEAF